VDRPLKIVQLTPGAGNMYCGGCFRDNALVKALRQAGHDVIMIPLYLPLNLEDGDQSAQTPIFFSGINVYLEQKLPLFRKLPRWINRMLASPALLRQAGKAAAKTRPEDTGELMLSMLRGEAGNQARELEELIHWLKTQEKPDVICLSNVLLAGMARELKKQLQVPVVCTFQGEDGFLDALPPACRLDSWDLLRERALDIDLFIAPSGYYASLMSERLKLPQDRVHIIYNGIPLDGFAPASAPPRPLAYGYFARMCSEKGLETVVESFLILKQRNRLPGLRLRIGGSLSPADEPFLNALKGRLQRNGCLVATDICPNLSRAEKQDFYRSLSVMSVPVLGGEAFGLYVAEAMASGVPVVLPSVGSFPELVRMSGGGIIYNPPSANELADQVEALLQAEPRRLELGQKGRQAALTLFSMERMAQEVVETYRGIVKPRPEKEAAI
jgi:glycosyltransferase involved in cell wall biosynthesis